MEANTRWQLPPPKLFRLLEMFSFLVVMVMLQAGDAQQRPGFISIDCGSPVTEYPDPVTGLLWENDAKYTDLGQGGTAVSLIDESADNWRALNTFQYFSEPRNKFCYELPLTRTNVSFLIRAMFYLDEAIFFGNSFQIIDFNVYVDTTFVFNLDVFPEGVVPGPVALLNKRAPLVWEGVFRSSRTVVDVCLVPNGGDGGYPFISSLELRELDGGSILDSLINSDKLFLSNVIRWNAGATANTPSVRYRDDRYDRLWMSSGAKTNTLSISGAGCNSPSTASGSTSSGSPISNATSSSYVPDKVLETGCLWNGEIGISGGLSSVASPPKYDTLFSYALFYLADSNGSRKVDARSITAGDVKLQIPEVDDDGVIKLFYQRRDTHLEVLSIEDQYFAPDGPSLNLYAVELFNVYFKDSSSTDPLQETLIKSLMPALGISNSSGDPCVPAPYEWLGCTTAETSQTTYSCVEVYEDLSSCKGANGVAQTLSWNIDSIDLSVLRMELNTTLIEGVISILSQLETVEYLDVSSSNLGESDFGNLVESLGSNLSTTSNTNSKQISLVYLNASSNQLAALPQNRQNIVLNHGLSGVSMLDLSNNNLSISLSYLQDYAKGNFVSLTWLNAANNNLSGVLNSSVSYLLSLNSLLLDGNQNIQGVLDLTAWYNLMISLSTETITQDRVYDSSSYYVDGYQQDSLNGGVAPLLSLSYTRISGIQPGVEKFEQMLSNITAFSNLPIGLDFFLHFGGILLKDTPFCDNIPPKFSASKAFFCHFQDDQSYYFSILSQNFNKGPENIRIVKKTFVILMSVLASLTLIGALFMAIVGGRLLQKSIKNVQAVREVQQEIQRALEQSKVQPPFYSYNDLKLATRTFHEDNKLGVGGFGAVYKGILPDETAIAVKRLFNAQQEQQVINDFLNEVVLINGIKHKNLVQLKGCCITEKERILVYELAQEGNLAQALWGNKSSKILSWEERFNICLGIARGLCYLHEELQPRIIHRDIKPANILLDKYFNAKIGDFGLARSFSEEATHADYTHVAGTRGYFAPEYVTQGHLTEKVDVFSFGILVLEIVSGRTCLNLKAPPEQMYLKFWAEDLLKQERLHELVDPQMGDNNAVGKVIQIALICVQEDPNLRPSMSKVITLLLGNASALPDLSILLATKRQLNFESTLEDSYADSSAASSSGFTDFLRRSKRALQPIPDVREEVDKVDEAPLLTDSENLNTHYTAIELADFSFRS